MGDLELAPEMVFLEGKLSIKCKIKEVYANEAAWAAFTAIILLPITPEHGMWNLTMFM